MNEGISSGNRDTIGLPVFLEDRQVSFDAVEGFVSLGVIFAVAALTVEIAGLRDLEPGDGIVRQVPREPVVPVVVENERHENPRMGSLYLRCAHRRTRVAGRNRRRDQ